MRPTLSGAVWGLVLGTAGLGFVSLMNPLPQPANQPQSPQAAEKPAASQSASSPAPTVITQAPAEALPSPVSEPVQDSAPIAPVQDTAPPAAPVAAPIAGAGQTDLIPQYGGGTDAQPAVIAATPAQPAPPVPEAAPAPVRPAAVDLPDISATVTDDRIADADTITPVAPSVPEPDVTAPPPEPQADAPIATQPAEPALPRIVTGVRVNRPETAPTQSDNGVSAPPVTQEDDVDSPALIRFAAAFENPAGWPLIGVVLLDDGTFDAPAAMLAELSLPLTVILDPAMPDARSRMQAYRAAGAETGLQTVLPQGARAQDVEITLEAALSTLPEALVLFSGADDAMQNDRIIYDQMITALADKGVGLITITRGLNPVARNATEAGVPTAMVLRDLAGMDDAAMRRSLDQAALRARQGVDVVISAPLTADVLVMLAQWSNSARVAVAPASAILSGD